MSDLLRILKAIAPGAKLFALTQRAANGDPEAIAYLKQHGLYEALDLWLPGAGDTGRQIVHHTQEAASGVGALLRGEVGPIEGEFREVLPWDAFIAWLKGRRWGTFVIIGPKGQGKTTLAMRLAQVWQQKTGRPVLAVNAFPEDRHAFVEPVPVRAFVAEMKRIVELLNKPLTEDGEEGEPWGVEELMGALERYKQRILVIDEMSLAVSPSGQDANRHLMRQLMAQARHLETCVIYIGQLVKMLPQDLLASDVIFVKRPNGREPLTDRQEPLTVDLWQRATEAFRHLRSAPGYERLTDIRSWAYVDCPDMGGGRSYRGLMPFQAPWLEADQERGPVALLSDGSERSEDR